MYSSSVILVLSVGKGVYGFTLDPLYGEFVLTHKDIQIPKKGKIYSFNEGNYALWDDKLKKYVDSLKEPGPSNKPYSARYIGSLVGDFHRTMLYGGIYGYPADLKSKTGKLRLLYECAPMSYLAEQAGGKGSDGHKRILDIQPEQVCNSDHPLLCDLLFLSPSGSISMQAVVLSKPQPNLCTCNMMMDIDLWITWLGFGYATATKDSWTLHGWSFPGASTSAIVCGQHWRGREAGEILGMIMQTSEESAKKTLLDSISIPHVQTWPHFPSFLIPWNISTLVFGIFFEQCEKILGTMAKNELYQLNPQLLREDECHEF